MYADLKNNNKLLQSVRKTTTYVQNGKQKLPDLFEMFFGFHFKNVINSI